MKSLIPFYLVGSLMLSPIAWAEGGSDRALERVQQLRDKAEAVLVQAEKAPVCERQVHMNEHMGMLEDMMSQLHKDHPGPNVSTEEHLAWMEKHDKLVDNVLDQMIREHKLMTTDKECHQ
ncbi:co-regulatory protein PtrA N-terminal domain-containing protein [Pseudomonas sp. Q2-TVG4-2]|uniref:co-regulatory protein PtrA N-terminal domain-containing protein n=1 Tax=Pseudomonas sp. Q2-TVG4-2 TaxID=1685699 RepID=UPI0015E72FF4|nr:co-regulatory protein PtrA N-terminal domain-containing protein [Pseudomonas sp. Q2-TVG4-2]